MSRCPSCGRVYCICPRRGEVGPVTQAAVPACGHGICFGPGGCIVPAGGGAGTWVVAS